MNGALKPYLARSLAAHAFAAAGLAMLMTSSARRADKIYTIDFVGAPAVAAVSAGAAGGQPSRASAAAAPRPQAERDDFATGRRRRRAAALPRPSLLRGFRETPRTASRGASLAGSVSRGSPSAAPSTAAPGPADAGGKADGAPGGAGIETDLPNFPFPWYIAQMRLMLWQAWQRRMPRFDAAGAVGFSILRNGAITDLSVESSSGETDFDKAALSAVQAAAPFPALPPAFHERFLKIHLTLTSQQSWR